MKRRLFILLFAALAAAPGGYAQKAYKTPDNKVILDMTTGMPEGSTTNIKKYDDSGLVATTFNGFLIASADAVNPNQPNGSINAAVFEKLEIAPFDMDITGKIASTGSIEDKMNWIEAFNRCKNADFDGGGWRLPTQRESNIMWIFKPALNSLLISAGGEKFKEDSVGTTRYFYWNSSEMLATDAGSFNFMDATPGGGAKRDSYRARCVREIVE